MEKLTSLKVQAAFKNDKGDFFLRSDIDDKTYTAGCHHWHHQKEHFHSYEVTYDAKKEAEGIKGKPIYLRWAGEYLLTPTITWKTKIEAKKEVLIENSWI